MGGAGELLAVAVHGLDVDGAGPAGIAESLCSAVADRIGTGVIVTTVDDGLGDYLVWLQNED